jgi:hypothetical protein
MKSFVTLHPILKKEILIWNYLMMLFSMVNMKLRDCYHSLDELCDDMNVDKELLVKKLKAAGFEYSKENNKFW